MSKNEKNEERKTPNTIITIIGGIILFSILMYCGGWSLLWGSEQITTKAFLIMDNGFSIRINDLYYGGTFSDRFFDAPAISWGILFLSLAPLGGGFFFINSSGE